MNAVMKQMHTERQDAAGPHSHHEVRIPPLSLAGTLCVPHDAYGIVLFAHGSGSSRLSPRNMSVAEALNDDGLATLLFDLLTPDEEDMDNRARVFDIPLLARRLIDAIHFIQQATETAHLPIGLFGASTGAAAAIVAAAQLRDQIKAVVSRGGRPDLAGPALGRLSSPTLLIVGGADEDVLALNEQAATEITAPKNLTVIRGATHLFPEAGAMEQVISHASRWFNLYLRRHGKG